MNCQKYRFKAQQQKTTWLKNIPDFLLYFHVIGDPNMEKSYNFDYNEKILWVKTEDDYNSLPKKVIASYQAILETFDFKYIFKTDDDQKLIKADLFHILQGVLENKKPKVHYAGHIVDVHTPYLCKYNKIHPELPDNLPLYKTKYCNGRFYILSREAVKDLSKKRNLIEKEYLEDYAIGYYLNDVFKENIMEIKNEKFFIDFVV